MNTMKNMLQKEEILFELIQHERPIYSAQDGADYFKIEIGQTAPTLIIHTDNGFYAVVISGSRNKIDFKEIEKVLKCHSARMATKKEVEQVTGNTAGTIPLLGLPLSYVMDRQLFQYDFIFGGTGKSDYTLKVNPDALVKINNVVGML